MAVFEPTELARDWLRRLGGAARLSLQSELSRFPGLAEAVTPVGFELDADDSSYIAEEGEGLVVEVRGPLVPGGGERGGAPEAYRGGVGLFIDTTERYCEIETLDTPAAIQGRGLGRLLLAQIVDLGQQLGLEALTLEAGKVGRYAWARCGFAFFDEDERERVVDAANEFAEGLGQSLDLSAVQQPWEIADLPGEVTREQVADAGGPPVPRGKDSGERLKLGQALLLGPPMEANSWFGRFDLKPQSPSCVRLRGYVRTGVVGADS